MSRRAKPSYSYLSALFLSLAALTEFQQAMAAEEELPAVEVKGKQEQESSINLKAKTSTGSRLGLTNLETPASVETLDAETVKLRGDFSIREAVSRTTGFTDISNLGTGVAYSARGFTGNNSVAQAEDGIRLLVAATTITYPSDSWGYERFEVLRGPASVLFGDASVGGIVNSIRKAPSREFSLQGLVSGGTQGAYRLGIGGTAPVGEVGAVRIDASASGGQGHVDDGRYYSHKLMTNFEIKPSDTLKLNFIYDHSDENPMNYTGIPLKNGRIKSELRDENYNVDNAIQEFLDDRLKAKLDWDISDSLKLTNTAYWFNSRRHWRGVELYALGATPNTVDRNTYTEIQHKQRQLGNQTILAGTSELWNHENKWSIGYEVARVDFQYFDNFYLGNDPSSTVDISNSNPGLFQTIDPTLKEFTSKTVQQALFVEDAFRITPDLTLSAGLRQDWIDLDHTATLPYRTTDYNKQFSPFSFRLGATYLFSPNTSLYGQWSQGSDPVSTIVSTRSNNRNFKLTSAEQAEIGIKHVLDNRKGEFTVAIYDISKDDILTRDPSNPTQTVQGGKQSSRGIEFSASLLPLDHWRTDFNLAILDAQYDELREGSAGISRAGNTPVDVPERGANAWVYYQQPLWQAGLGARFVGERYSNNANTTKLPGYTVYDANVAWHINKNVTLRGSIRNLTNKLYAAVSYDTEQFLIGESRRAEIRGEFNF
ncbi:MULTISPECIES: TonB-dependent siderophore receptor [unclassified Methylophilus]|uniref:TonB-dependent receptor n=1 Tax=unclassified Methylophilus TaxID=2630143 RepID=UPI0006FA51CB|nr:MULTISPECIES: TonB-dependent receptor [unclassified Methylophilus]KQT37274.1 TonB-dependent receptor [Methylophilus sp. Leaf416]KQT55556.1 TonB-dependent receptor [Methylophilus sp. Leaf459]